MTETVFLCRSQERGALTTVRLVGATAEFPSDQTLAAHLVPEPTKWHDPEAVRVEVDGQPIGYLDRRAAGAWHDIVTAFRGLGYRAVAQARGALVTVPGVDLWGQIHEALGFESEFLAFLDGLPKPVLNRLAACTPEQFDAPDLVRTLFEYRNHIPSFEWERILTATHRAALPGRLRTRLARERGAWRRLSPARHPPVARQRQRREDGEND